MKRLISSLMVLLMVFALVSCSVTVAPNEIPEPLETDEPTPAPATMPVTTEEPPATVEPVTLPPDTPKPVETPVVNENQAAFTAYKSISSKIAAKSGEVTEIDMDIRADISIRVSGESIDNNMTGNIKMKDMGGGKVAYNLYFSMGELGIVEMVSDGDRIYCAANGVEVPIDMSAFDTQLDSSIKIPDFNLDDMLETETWQEGGLTYTSILIDGDAMTAFVDELTASLASTIGGSTADISIGDLYLVLAQDQDGNPKSMRMDMTMSISAGGETAAMDMVYEYIINKIGSGVEIDFSKLG